MARSKRFVLNNIRGRHRQNYNWAPINRNSVVIITACEFRYYGGIAGPSGRPHLGEADVYVTNIGPHDAEGTSTIGGVEFHVHANSSQPIHVMVTITVLDDPE